MHDLEFDEHVEMMLLDHQTEREILLGRVPTVLNPVIKSAPTVVIPFEELAPWWMTYTPSGTNSV
jgi:hypothetical protein